MADVFISFVHEEKDIASAVQALILEELQLAEGVFLSEDRGQVFAGDQWLVKIREALASAKVVVLMFSKRASVRPWVNFEAGAAWVAGKPLIPCCYGNMRKESLPHPYSTIQALDLRTEVDYLLASLHHHLQLPGPAPRRRIFDGMALEREQTLLQAYSQAMKPRNVLARALENHVDIEFAYVVKRRSSAGEAGPSPAPPGSEQGA